MTQAKMQDGPANHMLNPQAKVLCPLDRLSIAELALKPTAIEGTEPKEATESAFTVTASKAELGFWECSPGRFQTAHKGVNEVVLVLEGRATLVSDTGERLDHQGGDNALI